MLMERLRRLRNLKTWKKVEEIFNLKLNKSILYATKMVSLIFLNRNKKNPDILFQLRDTDNHRSIRSF